MFSLTICFGPQGTMWQLLFRTKEKIETEIKCLRDGDDQLLIADDFGQTVTVAYRSIHAWMIEDMTQSKVARIDLALHAARTQAEAQIQAESDQMLKSVRARQNGPALINPMGMPGNGRMF